MFRQVGVPVLGAIENMSYLLCGHCGEPTSIFGQGGGQQLATLQVPLLGKVPLSPQICAGGDTGQPIVLAEPKSPASQVFEQTAAGIINTFSMRSIKRVSLPVAGGFAQVADARSGVPLRADVTD